MNKFIKLPLFLGATCLIAGGLLAGVVALTDPVIEASRLEKLSQAFRTMYNDENAATVATAEITDEFIEQTGIQSITKVEHAEGTSVVYQCKSKSKYETMLFYIGISQDSGAVDNYYNLETNTSSLGYASFKDNDTITSLYEGYNGSGNPIIANITFTCEAVKDVVDNALEDFNANRKEW